MDKCETIKNDEVIASKIIELIRKKLRLTDEIRATEEHIRILKAKLGIIGGEKNDYNITKEILGRVN